jgi:hypothetical protein
MSFYVESNSSFENCPPGLHLARCYRIIDLGTQETTYMGQVKFLHKILFGWEIHGIDDNARPLKTKDNRPFSIAKNYTLSWSEKANLRNDLQSWRGKQFTKDELNRFDLKNVLGAWCMLNVIEKDGQNGAVFSNVDSITPVPGALKASLPEPHNKLQMFNLAEPDMEVFNTLSDNMRAKIEKSPEWKRAKDGAPAPVSAPEGEDDIPF